MPNGKEKNDWQQKWLRKWAWLEPGESWGQKWFGLRPGESPATKWLGWRTPYTPPVAAVPGALSYEDFLNLSPEEQNAILTDASGGRLPDVTGSGYQWKWQFDPQTGTKWTLTAEEEAVGQKTYSIETDPSGYYVYVTRNADGNIIGYDPMDRVPTEEQPSWQPEGITPYQRAQLGLEEKRLGLEQMSEAARLAALGERGWIERWYNEQMGRQQTWNPPVPWQERPWPMMTPKQRGAFSTISESGTRRDEFPTLHPELEGRRRMGWGGTSQELAEGLGLNKYDKTLKVAREEANKWRDLAMEYTLPTSTPRGPFPVEKVGAKEAYGMAGGGGGYTTRPESPRVPELGWLPQVATLGERIHEKKGKVKTPSGQLWSGLPSSERGTFAGMMDYWKNESYQDMLDRMAMMRPRTPSIRKRWSPAKQ